MGIIAYARKTIYYQTQMISTIIHIYIYIIYADMVINIFILLYLYRYYNDADGIFRFISRQYFTLNNGGKGIQVDTTQNLIFKKKKNLRNLFTNITFKRWVFNK